MSTIPTYSFAPKCGNSPYYIYRSFFSGIASERVCRYGRHKNVCFALNSMLCLAKSCVQNLTKLSFAFRIVVRSKHNSVHFALLHCSYSNRKGGYKHEKRATRSG